VLIKVVGTKLARQTGPKGDCAVGSLMICAACQELLCELIKKNDIGGVCGMYGGQEKRTYGSGV
jgi:hypothetical protein